MIVTLKKVFTSVKTTKFGDKLSVGLKIEEPTVTDINGQPITVGDKYLNAWFDKNFIFPHTEGEKVDILITTRGEYIDFKLPGIGKPPAPDLGSIIDRIKKLEDVVYNSASPILNSNTGTTEPSTPAPDDVVDPTDW